MDIALLSMSLSQGKVQEQASLSVMKMAMGNEKQQGDAIQSLLNASDKSNLEQAIQPHLGGKINIKI